MILENIFNKNGEYRSDSVKGRERFIFDEDCEQFSKFSVLTSIGIWNYLGRLVVSAEEEVSIAVHNQLNYENTNI